MVQVDVSHFANFFGGHDFKVGFGRMKNVNKVQEGYPGGGFITLNWDTAFTNPVTDRLSVVPMVTTRSTRRVPAVQPAEPSTTSMCRIAGDWAG